ncbi:fructosamine kinase family protein [Virgibacillus kekensis]|uniref:Fructosamine kinase family protein n=1 Tax=Virgibacillus kekensis TaxID=202261 RepID=A0ABV9DNV8_9BACI
MKKQVIIHALHTAEDNSPIKSMKQVSGGSINESYYVETAEERYFIKYHTNPPARFFEIETSGLELIRQTDTISVPDVYAYSDEKNNAFLVMEWVEGNRKLDTEEKLGSRISAMHQHTGEKHGYEEDTFIGTLPQPNGLFTNWVEYYRDQRLTAQLNQGINQERITGIRRQRLEDLLDKLDKFVPANPEPSYLHGDFWGGNWLVGENGAPYIIDPSFLYGDRHFELAFTELFGGYSEDFYHAYNEKYAMADYYDDVKPLYQLYYLLVHLNIFGESYGSRVDAVLRKFT